MRKYGYGLSPKLSNFFMLNFRRSNTKLTRNPGRGWVLQRIHHAGRLLRMLLIDALLRVHEIQKDVGAAPVQPMIELSQQSQEGLVLQPL